MFDNLIARAIVPVTIAVTGFVIFGCLLLYSFIKADMTAEALRNLDSCANTVAKSTRYAMMEDDRRSLQNIVANIGTRPDVELIGIYDRAGNLHYSGSGETTATAAAGTPQIPHFLQDFPAGSSNLQHAVDHADGHIAVTMPILNETKCSTSACHSHPEKEQILGYLFIGVSSEQLEKTLALLRSRMVVFSLMVLFLTVGGVTALLRMNLFLPILRLTHTVERAVQGEHAAALPKPDRKLDGLGKNIYQLIEQRDQARQTLDGEKAVGADDEGIDDTRRDPHPGHRTAPQAGSDQD